MPSILSSSELKYTRPGDPPRSPVWNNFVQTSKRQDVLRRNHYGNPFQLGQLEGQNTSGFDIPPYSIFTIKTPGESFYIGQPSAEFARPTGQEQFFLTNDVTAVDNNQWFRGEMVSGGSIFRFKYTGTAPTTGDTVGPIEDSFEVSKDGTGLICVTEPDTTNNLLWAAAVGLGGAFRTLCKITASQSAIGPGEVGDVELWKQVGFCAEATEPEVISPQTIVCAANWSAKTLYSQVLHFLDFNLLNCATPVIWPEEFEECFQPENQSANLT